jgi:hypothetical protein
MKKGERGGAFWTRERDDELLRVSQKLRGKALGEYFGVTASYCRVRLRQLRGHVPVSRLALTTPAPTQVDDTVQQRVRAAADYRRGFVVPPEKQAEYFELLKKGLPVAEVRRRLAL